MRVSYKRVHRIRRTQPIFSNKIFLTGILALAVLSTFFYLFFFLPTFQIKEIKVSGTEKVSQEAVEQLLEKQICKKILFLSSLSIFLPSKNEIKQTIIKAFPQVEDIELRKEYPNVLLVFIKERVAVGSWCNKEEKCFLIDKQGIIFEQAVDTQLPVIKSSYEEVPKLSAKIIKKEDMDVMLKISQQLDKDLKLKIVEFVMVSPSDLEAKTSEGWWIYFNPLNKDIDWQIVELKSVLEKEVSSRDNLEYINLRFEEISIYPGQE